MRPAGAPSLVAVTRHTASVPASRYQASNWAMGSGPSSSSNTTTSLRSGPGVLVGQPRAGIEVVQLAPPGVSDEVGEAQRLVVHDVGIGGLDGVRRQLQVVHRDAHVDVVGDVDHDPVEEEVETEASPQ